MSRARKIAPTVSFGSFLKAPRQAIRYLRQDPIALIVYLTYLDRAAFEAGWRVTRCGRVYLEIGECLAGTEDVALENNLERGQVRAANKRLLAASYITTKATTLGTIVTVCGLKESFTAQGGEQPPKQPPKQPDKRPPEQPPKQPPERPLSRSGDQGDPKDPKDREICIPEDTHTPSVLAVTDGYSEIFKRATNSDHVWSKPLREAAQRLLRDGATPDQILRHAEVMHFETSASEFPQSRDFATLARHFNLFAQPRLDALGVARLAGESPRYIPRIEPGKVWRPVYDEFGFPRGQELVDDPELERKVPGPDDPDAVIVAPADIARALDAESKVPDCAKPGTLPRKPKPQEAGYVDKSAANGNAADLEPGPTPNTFTRDGEGWIRSPSGTEFYWDGTEDHARKLEEKWWKAA